MVVLIKFWGMSKIAVVNEAPYWVLDTDYGNYSIVWSCTDLALFNFRKMEFRKRNNFLFVILYKLFGFQFEIIFVFRNCLVFGQGKGAKQRVKTANLRQTGRSRYSAGSSQEN